MYSGVSKCVSVGISNGFIRKSLPLQILLKWKRSLGRYQRCDRCYL